MLSAAYEVFGRGIGGDDKAVDLRALILKLRREGMWADMQTNRARKQYTALLRELQGVFEHQFVEGYNFGAVPITIDDEVTPFHVLDALQAKFSFDLMEY